MFKDCPTWLATDDGHKWKNTPEGQNWVSRTQMAQMSIETKDKEELDVTSNEDEEVTEQVWVAMAAQEVVEDLESCQSEATTRVRDKDVEEAMQLAEDELEVQCIWETFLQTQKDMLVSGEMQEIAGYIDSCNANSEPSRLHGTGPWYLDTACSRHMTNEKDLFIGKLQPNATKLECANGEILTSGGIGSVRLSCMDENRNPLTTRVDDVLYSPQAHSNLMSLGQLSEKGIDFKAVGNKMTLHRLGKTVATGVRIGRVFLLNSLRWSSKVLSSKKIIYRASTRSSETRQHCRLGHPGHTQSQQLPFVVLGLEKSAIMETTCEACIYAKQPKNISCKPMSDAKQKLGRVHMDLWGSALDISLQANKYMLKITDQNTKQI